MFFLSKISNLNFNILKKKNIALFCDFLKLYILKLTFFFVTAKKYTITVRSTHTEIADLIKLIIRVQSDKDLLSKYAR